MQFGYTILYVEDVPKTIAFYEAAFGFARRFVHVAGDYGELDTGATALAFSSLRLMAELGKNPQCASADAPSFEIAFTTPDVAAAVQRAVDAGLKGGKQIARDTRQHGLGLRVAEARVELQHVEAARAEHQARVEHALVDDAAALQLAYNR